MLQNLQELKFMYNKLDTQIATILTDKDAEDVGVLASIEDSSVARILRNLVLFEVERRRLEIKNYKRLSQSRSAA
jgi:hypothetical protein